MERRRAVAIAAAATASTVGAAAAIAANLGLLGFRDTEPTPLGQLNAGPIAELVGPTDTSTNTPAASPAPNVTVRYEDIYLPAPAVAPAESGTSPGDHDPGDHDRDGHDRDDHDRDDHGGDDHDREDRDHGDHDTDRRHDDEHREGHDEEDD